MDKSQTYLPHGWILANIKDLVDHLQYGYTAKASLSIKEPKYLRITDIKDDGVDWDRVPGCNIPAQDIEKYKLEEGDLVFARSGSIEKAYHITNPPISIFASYLIRGKPLHKQIGFYLKYFVKSRNYLSQIGALGAGIAMQNVNASKLGMVKIPISPLNEQKRIVVRIEELQAHSRRAREALDTVPNLLEQLRQSILAAAFRGDLTKEWRKKQTDIEPAQELLKRIRSARRKRWEETELEKIKAKGLTDEKLKEAYANRRKQYNEPAPVDAANLPELPTGWCWTSWEEIGFCQNGRAFPSKAYCSKGIKLLRPGNLHVSGNIEWTVENTRYMPKQWLSKNEEYIVGPNEIIINLTAQSLRDEFLGRVCLTGNDERCLLNQRLAKLTPILLSTSFCFWLLKSPVFRQYVDTLNTGSLIQHMFTTQIDNFLFPLPPYKEQSIITSRIRQLIASKELTNEIISKVLLQLDTLTQSILAKAFRGELVPQDQNEEPASSLLNRIRQEKASTMVEPKLKRKDKKLKQKQKEPRDIVAILRKTSNALTPEEVFAAADFDEASVDIFYEQLRAAIASKKIREIKKGKTIRLEALKP